MAKGNPALASFMMEKLGERRISGIEQILGFTIYRHFAHGYLPQNEERVVKLAEVLGCSAEELFELEAMGTAGEEPNLLPLIKVLAKSSVQKLTQSEFQVYVAIYLEARRRP